MTASIAPEEHSEPWLEVRDVSKRFGGATALEDVNVNFRRGEVHALLGANGAGKSTLIRCLAGVVAPDSGTILIDGEPVQFASPRDSEAAGLAFIHQELNLVPQASVLENIMLGLHKRRRFGVIDWRQPARQAREALDRIGARLDLNARVGGLTTGQSWLIAIGRALVQNASLIAMDEPTASLSDREATRLLAVMRELAASGVAVIFVSHRLDEVIQIADRITVFRNGHVIRSSVRAEATKDEIVEAIVGTKPSVAAPTPAGPVSATDPSDPVLEVHDMTRGRAVRNVSLTVYRNEILGLGGLVGAGRTELVRLIFGADRPDSGHLVLDGRRLRGSGIPSRIKAGIGMVPEERRAEGLFLDQSVEFNINLTALPGLRSRRGLPVPSSSRRHERAKSLMSRLLVKARSIASPVGLLSGGNQQKVLFGRWLLPNMRVLILDEPSRGVDVGARRGIHDVVRAVARGGVSVIVVSSDAEELATLCDRVIVMSNGTICAELSGDDISEQAIVELSYRGASAPSEVGR